MKKLILSTIAMASLAFAANAVTNMYVECVDGSVDIYDVDHVTELYYTEQYGVSVNGKVGLYTYVDLGLPSGTKWATYNVGATKLTELGDFFAWGETMPKEEFGKSTYKWIKVDPRVIDQVTKYCTTSREGTVVDNKTVLEAEDDAATANWGKEWRMPTAEEIEELIRACDWDIIHNFYGTGIPGLLGTSRYNGATIFLTNNGASKYHYWSSSLDGGTSFNADALSLTGYTSDICLVTLPRTQGCLVRAVLR